MIINEMMHEEIIQIILIGFTAGTLSSISMWLFITAIVASMNIYKNLIK